MPKRKSIKIVFKEDDTVQLIDTFGDPIVSMTKKQALMFASVIMVKYRGEDGTNG